MSWDSCNKWGDSGGSTTYSDPKRGLTSSARSGESSTTCPSNAATHVSTNYFADPTVLDPTRRGIQKKDTGALSSSYPSSSANSPKATTVTDNVKRMQFGCSFVGDDWPSTSTA